MNLSPLTHSAADVIGLLALEPLPHEGGWFRRTAEARSRDRDDRRHWSAILALYTPNDFSALHRLASEEIWLHRAGDPLDMLLLSGDVADARRLLGGDVASGANPQVVVPAGTWQGARLGAGGRWALVSCIVVPEFRWDDFELGDRASLQAEYPHWSETIVRFTRG